MLHHRTITSPKEYTSTLLCRSWLRAFSNRPHHRGNISFLCVQWRRFQSGRQSSGLQRLLCNGGLAKMSLLQKCYAIHVLALLQILVLCEGEKRFIIQCFQWRRKTLSSSNDPVARRRQMRFLLIYVFVCPNICRGDNRLRQF